MDSRASNPRQSREARRGMGEGDILEEDQRCRRWIEVSGAT
jgi:hypothetical protein